MIITVGAGGARLLAHALVFRKWGRKIYSIITKRAKDNASELESAAPKSLSPLESERERNPFLNFHVALRGHYTRLFSLLLRRWLSESMKP